MRARARDTARTAACVALAVTLSACTDERLDGTALEALYAGNVVEGKHMKKGYDFRGLYHPDGTFRSYQTGRKEPRDGQWWVDGDKICISWQDAPASLCRHVLKDGQGNYRKALVKFFWREVDVVKYHRISPGNHTDLKPFEHDAQDPG